MASETWRKEKDGFGVVEISSKHLWGAQTQRAVGNFSFGGENERMPAELIEALAMAKKVAAVVNRKFGKLKHEIADAIIRSAEEVIQGKHDGEFPLAIWQSGSGTQTNMNMNEVLSNRSIELLSGEVGTKSPVHPNDHVNLCQSTNDTFPTAMHVATAIAVTGKLLPLLEELSAAFKEKEKKYESTLKLGRTHLQDATPMTVGQEFSGFRCQVDKGIGRIRYALQDVRQLAQGGTAVGTGMNCYKPFAEEFVIEMSKLTGIDFVSSENKFEALSCNDAMVAISASLNGMAVSLMKIANDIRSASLKYI
eukprot:GHVS01079690.1.p1 GENE.GHVS01079690.1~~GHVS01079690.1.p1  ORF type:complete len:334 (-),score=49.14 GHVS01079690.1:197-1120(-)